jgi:ribosomal protein L37AE/L43A
MSVEVLPQSRELWCSKCETHTTAHKSKGNWVCDNCGKMVV